MKSRTALIRVVIGIAVVVASAVVILQRPKSPLTHPENYVHLLGWQTQREGWLNTQLLNFIGDVDDRVRLQTAPKRMNNIRDAVKWVRADTKLYGNSRYPDVLGGLDYWGQPYVFEITTADFGTEMEVTGFIRSIGANGIDENGGGDDLQQRFAPFTTGIRTKDTRED